MPDKEGFIDGTKDPDIQACVAEMAVSYEHRMSAAKQLTRVIAGIGGKIDVDFPTYFAHINQLSLEEAQGERHRKVGYYNALFNGLSPEDVGEPVLVTSLTMLQKMGMIGSFSNEEPIPVRYVIGANRRNERSGKILLALRQLQIPQTYANRPTFSETVMPIPVADEIAHRRYGGENISTDDRFRTKLYIGRQGVQRWVNLKFPGIGDSAVSPLLEAIETPQVA